MARRGPFLVEILAQWRLSLPLATLHLGQHLMSLVDATMLGHYHRAALAGAGIANGLLFAVTLFGAGVVMGLDTLVPQALGAGEPHRARRLFWSGVRVVFIVGLPLTAVAAASPLLLPVAGVAPAVASEATLYVLGRLPAVIPILLFVAQRSYLQAVGATRPLVIAMIAGNLINVAADYVFIFGDPGLARLGLPPLGLPPLGVLGASISSTLVSLAALAVGALGVRSVAAAASGSSAAGARIRGSAVLARSIMVLGLPVGLHLLAEVGLFAATAVLAGRLGEIPSAAHQIAVTLSTMSFSIALGVGAATSVRVGRAIGAGDFPAVRRAGGAGVSLGAAIMGVAGVGFLLWPRELASLLSSEPEVVEAAVPLLRIVAFFQVSDAAQAIAAGALRGAGKSRVTFLVNLIGHYALGLPVAMLLAFGAGMGAPGLWWGLLAGLTAVAIALCARFFHLASRPLARA